MAFHKAPQGSTCQPTLFNIFINDITSSIMDTDVQIILYADAVIYVSDVANIETKLQLVVHNRATWCRDNGLKIYVNTSKVCLYGTRNMLQTAPKINIRISNECLGFCESYNYLGVIIDECLTFQNHFNNNLSTNCPKKL